MTDAPPEPPSTEDDIEQARVRARVKQGLFGGPRQAVKVDGFSVRDLLGAGAMGVVYEAHDEELDRVVALKLLHPSEGSSETHTALLEEARAMAKVSHPNVVVVHRVGTHGQQVYVAMERARGTLREWLERDRPPPERILDVLIDVGRGLGAVHRRGLVHRDFKLDNVLMSEDGAPKVGDFGLALLAERDSDAEAVAGTPAYMAPEQLRGSPADVLSDQFAFCVTAVEALTGRRPFSGDTREALLQAMLARLGEADLAGVPRAVRPLLLRGLDPEPAKRFSSMDALVERLELARGGARRWPLWAGIAVAVAIAGGALALLRSGPVSPAPAASGSVLTATAPAPVAAGPVVDITRLCRTALRSSSAKEAHPAEHAFDGIKSTAWTESASGSGAGEWLEVELRPGTYVESVEVSGGWPLKTSSGVDLWQHNNTFRRMRVSWDGGESVVEFDRATDRDARKVVEVGAHTKTLRITALEVDRGRFSDLCLDEVVIRGRCAGE